MTNHLDLADGSRIAYRVAGTSGPWITMIHALMASSFQWEGQVAALSGSFRVLYPDTRGHGDSGATRSAISLALLASDVVELLDHLGVERTHLVAASMNGLVAQHFAETYPERLDRLVLSNTTWRYGEEASAGWQKRIEMVEKDGIGAAVRPTLDRFLTEGFRSSEHERTSALSSAMHRTDPKTFISCCRALDGADLSSALGRIGARTLLIAGRSDIATTPEIMKMLQARINRADLIVLPGAHLCNYESPDRYDETLMSFLAQPS